jgi:hypothetical protein
MSQQATDASPQDGTVRSRRYLRTSREGKPEVRPIAAAIIIACIGVLFALTIYDWSMLAMGR